MSEPVCTMPEMTVTGPFFYCSDSDCPVHGLNSIATPAPMTDSAMLSAILESQQNVETMVTEVVVSVKPILEAFASGGLPAIAGMVGALLRKG